MKKVKTWSALLIGLALILAACGQSNTGEETPGYTEEPLITEPGMPPVDNTPSGEITTPAVTAPVATATVSSTEPVSPTQSISPTQSVPPTTSAGGGEVIPPTGFIDPGRITNLLDFEACNQAGEQIGAVDDLILNLEEQKVVYVVVEADENNPVSKDLRLVPWEAMTVVSAQALTSTGAPSTGAQQTPTVEVPAAGGAANCFVLNVDQSRFDGAPKFDEAAFPKLGETPGNWDADIAAYWKEPSSDNATPAPGAATKSPFPGIARATELLELKLGAGDSVVDAAVDDILVDSQSGEIKYIVVSFDAGTGETKLFAIPVQVLQWNATNQLLTVTIDPQVVLQAPNFKAEDYPITVVPDWDADLRAYWESYLP